MKPALCVAVVSMLFGVQLAHAACPNDAVFLVLGDQIRGYSLRANGATEPCQVLQGPLTTLMTAGATGDRQEGLLSRRAVSYQQHGRHLCAEGRGQ